MEELVTEISCLFEGTFVTLLQRKTKRKPLCRESPLKKEQPDGFVLDEGHTSGLGSLRLPFQPHHAFALLL